MKTIITLMRTALLIWLALLSLSLQRVEGQICSSPNTVIYGLTGGGFIYPITVSTGVEGPAINPPYAGNAPLLSNAMGYNELNGKFYYFKRNLLFAPQEFVSFDPATNIVTILASCPSGSTLINLGCCNQTGTGYYCLDNGGSLYYYNIALNTWTTITSTIKDQFGTVLSTITPTHFYGDLIFDGLGALWMVCSSNSQFGLYKVNAPLPITPVPVLNCTQILPPTTATPGGNSFGGIAFNTTGQIYMSSNTPENKLYRLENNYTLTYLSTFVVDGVGNDLTSCNFPNGVLPVFWQSFSAAETNNNSVALTWKVIQQMNSGGYFIEHSVDGSTWSDLGFVENSGNTSSSETYTFIHPIPAKGHHYYRIRQVDKSGSKSYSEIRMIDLKTFGQIAIGPNPAKDIIKIDIENTNPENNLREQLFEISGKMVHENILHKGLNVISLGHLPTGSYIVRIQSSDGQVVNQKIFKE